MSIWLVAAAIGVMLLFPQTLAGRALRRLLVEIPAERLNRLRRGHVILLITLAAMLGVAVLAGREALMVSGMYLPEGVAWLAAFDIATYVDVIAAALIVAASVRIGAAVAAGRAAVRRLGPRVRRPRARRARNPRPKRPAPDESDPWGGLALA
jgi:hypothetical protein